jgi:hypothetical protein
MDDRNDNSKDTTSLFHRELMDGYNQLGGGDEDKNIETLPYERERVEDWVDIISLIRILLERKE